MRRREDVMGINKFRLVACACASVVYLVTSVPAVSAQSMVLDSLTVFTFSQPVEFPGVILPAGTYEFRFADAYSGRKVMRVTAKDKTHKQYGLFITITTQRPDIPDDAELRLTEARAGQTAAVKTWWYPGETTGREFIYPREQARR